MPKRLLLIDAIPTHRIRLKAALRVAHYEVVSVDRISCAKGAANANSFDLIILNTSGADPGQMTARLKKTLGEIDVPVLCRDAEADSNRRLQALLAGARDLVATRLPTSLFLARLRAILRDNDVAAEIERRSLAAASFGFREANSPFQTAGQVVSVALGSPDQPGFERALSQAHRLANQSCDELLNDGRSVIAPDAILLNVGQDGSELLESVLPEIRSRSHLRQASVIVLHPPGDHEIAQRALNLGAADITEIGSSDAELIHRIDTLLARKRARDSLRRSTEESFKLATVDDLTGLYNRRYAGVYLADALVQASESGSALTVMMIDVDHFKLVNDKYGHTAGDDALCEIARRMRDNLRAVDLVARQGGEEFLVILPGLAGDDAELAAERLRMKISEPSIRLPDGTEFIVTASIGVAIARPSPQLAQESITSGEEGAQTKALIDCLFRHADQALYAAKRAGRNRVAVNEISAAAA